ncbi:MAG: hypothetical protein GAK38_00504 [Xylophilus sp.]|nr:MAG: hypothetical protein GAK38_00504 [Xylophilus sp.]
MTRDWSPDREKAQPYLRFHDPAASGQRSIDRMFAPIGSTSGWAVSTAASAGRTRRRLTYTAVAATAQVPTTTAWTPWA